MTGILNLITNRLEKVDLANPLSLLDIFLAVFLVASFIYYLRKFPVFRVLVGILVLIFCSVVFLLSGFIYTALVFGVASNLILIALPLIFAPEIRHYLEKLGRFSYLKIPSRFMDKKSQEIFIKGLVDAVYELAERKMGATVVLRRRTGLAETSETGTKLEAKFSSKLLQNIFFPKSPLHDGAVIIKDQKIFSAGCLLPINAEVKLDPPFGTRHKSALAITKDTDAVVLIVSEQRGEVSLAENGKLDVNLDRIELSEKLHKLLG